MEDPPDQKRRRSIEQIQEEEEAAEEAEDCASPVAKAQKKVKSRVGAPSVAPKKRKVDGKMCYIVPVKSYLRLKTGREAAEVELQQWRSKRRTAEKERRRKRRDMRKRAALAAVLRTCAVWGNKTADVVALVSYSLNG